jgi:Zn-dependent protease
MDISTVIFIVILIISIVFHEVAHGYMANLLGDPTARLQGRLTLNPIKHIDPLGSIIVPAFLIISGSKLLFGWAKPVPYNPYNLKKGGRFAEALVAFAGPLANISIAIFTVLLYKFGFVSLQMAGVVIYMNLFLALLNLIPIPPLDGSKILPAFLSNTLRLKLQAMMVKMEQGGIATMIFVLIFLSIFAIRPLASFVDTLTALLLGF